MQDIERKREKVRILKKRSDFLRVAGAEKKWITPAIIVQVCPQNEDLVRVGYTASKKVGNAVLRNRAKRRMREIARQVLLKTGRRGHDYVLIARPEIINIPFKALIRDLKWSLKRLHGDNGKQDRVH